jgi:hypothetical protein
MAVSAVVMRRGYRQKTDEKRSQIKPSTMTSKSMLALGLSWKRHKAIGAKVARFRQIDMNKPYVHHDALEFPDGQCVLVTRLMEGQKVTALQLPATPQEKTQESQRNSVALNPVAQGGGRHVV